MRSWLTIFLPKDEFKRNSIISFLAEAAVILFAFFILMTISLNFISVGVDVMIITSIGIFIFYVLGRYTISGIEYADVYSNQEYEAILKSLIFRSVFFVVLLGLGYAFLVEFPKTFTDYIFNIGVPLTAGLLYFLINFISLKQSYKKNKELL